MGRKKNSAENNDDTEIPPDNNDDSFCSEHDTDLGGLYKRSGTTVNDENSDNPPAGTPGHPGTDEDTA